MNAASARRERALVVDGLTAAAGQSIAALVRVFELDGEPLAISTVAGDAPQPVARVVRAPFGSYGLGRRYSLELVWPEDLGVCRRALGDTFEQAEARLRQLVARGARTGGRRG